VEKEHKKVNKMLIYIFCIIFASFFAILVHALMPTAVNIEDFDSILVKTFGFPIVATSYFVLLYIHCTLVTQHYGKRSDLSNKDIGLRFGFIFAGIYLLGMQEVIVEASPFLNWGIKFVTYQLFMGLGDAIPVILLCMLISKYILPNKKEITKMNSISKKNSIISILIIAIAFFAIRTIGYEWGFIGSNVSTFPLPSYMWTAIFGIFLGFAFIVLYPIFKNKEENKIYSFNLVVLTLGINWIIFNSFIGFIFSDTMSGVLLRSGLDVIAIYIAVIFIDKYLLCKKDEKGINVNC